MERRRSKNTTESFPLHHAPLHARSRLDVIKTKPGAGPPSRRLINCFVRDTSLFKRNCPLFSSAAVHATLLTTPRTRCTEDGLRNRSSHASFFFLFPSLSLFLSSSSPPPPPFFFFFFPLPTDSISRRRSCRRLIRQTLPYLIFFSYLLTYLLTYYIYPPLFSPTDVLSSLSSEFYSTRDNDR